MGLNRHPVTNAPLPSGMEVTKYGGACTESFSGPEVSATLAGGIGYKQKNFLKGETLSLPVSLIAAKLHHGIVAKGSEAWEAGKALLDECKALGAEEDRKESDARESAALDAELASLDERKAVAVARLAKLKDGPKHAKKTAKKGK